MTDIPVMWVREWSGRYSSIPAGFSILRTRKVGDYRWDSWAIYHKDVLLKHAWTLEDAKKHVDVMLEHEWIDDGMP